MDGFDWNRNGYRDAGDSYIDYEIMNGSGGSGGGNHGSGGSGGSGGDGCGCLTIVFMIVGLMYLLGSCS